MYAVLPCRRLYPNLGVRHMATSPTRKPLCAIEKKNIRRILAPHGLYTRDTQSGELRFIAHDSNVKVVTSVVDFAPI